MVRQADTIDNPVTGERITFLETSLDTRGESLRIAWSLKQVVSCPAVPTPTRTRRNASRFTLARSG